MSDFKSKYIEDDLIIKNRDAILNDKQVIKKIKSCFFCNSSSLEYWDETDEEIIYKCEVCKRYITVPFKNDKLRFYFSF
ncbi:MAG: hypothetical protein ACTSVV_00970 [Promethearchaeota archaeon]